MKNSIAHFNKWKYIIYRLRSFIIRDQKYKPESKDKERDQTKKIETLYETTEDTTGYQELGEFRDISNYDKLTWAMHSAAWNLFSGVICNFFCLFRFVPLMTPSLIWRLHHYRWTTANFEIFSALLAIEREWLLRVMELCDTRHPFRIVISEDPWHLQLTTVP